MPVEDIVQKAFDGVDLGPETEQLRLDLGEWRYALGRESIYRAKIAGTIL